jgi:hypothetical protein
MAVRNSIIYSARCVLRLYCEGSFKLSSLFERERRTGQRATSNPQAPAHTLLYVPA